MATVRAPWQCATQLERDVRTLLILRKEEERPLSLVWSRRLHRLFTAHFCRRFRGPAPTHTGTAASRWWSLERRAQNWYCLFCPATTNNNYQVDRRRTSAACRRGNRRSAAVDGRPATASTPPRSRRRSWPPRETDALHSAPNWKLKTVYSTC